MVAGSSLLTNIRVRVFFFLWIPYFLTCSFSGDKDAHDNVNLAGATWLVAEAVKTQVNDEGVPVQPGQPTPPVTPLDDLFRAPLGKPIPSAALSGAIDPVGTTIVNDFDGDGILNANETTSNVWVSDYPVIETVIAPPVTMKIRILKNSNQQSDELVSEINSDDFESTKNEGSEKIHQAELNLRTVQFQDSFSNTASEGGSTGSTIGGGLTASGYGVNYSRSLSNSWEASNSTSSTTTKWADKPFKNNIDSDSLNRKSTNANNKARKYRSDKSQKINSSSVVDANAGYVRAALYIKNLSVNMPVKLSNILCSLMFENADGDLIPIQSFRLRNDDYSLFEIEVYGGSEFGPYIIELSDLNTVEIEKAIALGYNPKIYIVDYKMTHVADSNYRSALSNFSGDNLKIVEENAKSRTSLIKIYGPNIRELFRVTAFDVPANEESCTTKTVSTFSPGVMLKKALNRIACSGLEITYKDYVFDLSEIAPKLAESKAYVKSIQSVAGVSTYIPCDQQTFTGSDGISRTACVQKPLSEWTLEDKQRAGVWMIFSKGKYFNSTEYFKDGSNVRFFDPQNLNKAPMLKGIESMIWAGDNYDIVYISLKDLLIKEETFGTNPLETGKEYSMNTAWDLTSMGEHPYYPDTNSLFLGNVGFGEKIELKIKLNRTKYLNPDFGIPTISGVSQFFDNFNYNLITTTDRYEIDEVPDFEVSLGFGGTRTDWLHVVRDLSSIDEYKPQSCGQTLDFLTQTFTLCIMLPTRHDTVSTALGLVKLYIRPALNSGYRRTVWPLSYTDARKVRAKLIAPLVSGATSVTVGSSSGQPEVDDQIYILGNTNSYRVTQVSNIAANGTYTITVDTPILYDAPKTTEVYVKGALTEPDIRITLDNNFLTDWNTQNNSNLTSQQWTSPINLPLSTTSSINCTAQPFHPGGCLGFHPDYNAINWMGGYNLGVALWNSWTDGGNFETFLSGGLTQIVSNTGRTMKLESAKTDFTMSTNTGATAISDPFVAQHGDISFILYKRDLDLFGRYYQISTGLPLSAQFKVNTAAATGYVAMEAYNGKLGIAWESSNGNDIYVTFLDMVTQSSIGAELRVASTTHDYSNTGRSLDIAVGLNGAMVFWNQFAITTQPGDPSGCGLWGLFACPTKFFSTSTVFGRAYRLDTGAAIGAQTTVYQNQRLHLGDALPLDTVVSAKGVGNQAAVSYWLRNLGAPAAQDVPPEPTGLNIQAVSYDLSTGTRIGNVQSLVSASNVTLPVSFTVTGESSRGMVFWKFPDNTTTARGWNTATGNLLGSSNFNIDKCDDFKVKSLDTLAIFNYSKSGIVYSRVIDLIGGNMLYSNALQLNTSTTPSTTRRAGQTYISGNRAISLWEHKEGSGKSTIRGRIFTIAPFALKGGSEFIISTTNQGDQTGPDVYVTGSKALTIWKAADTNQPWIRGFRLDLDNPGAITYGLNNFFVAPLVERDFTVKAKIQY
ncbi:LIC12048 family lipoprotein [Leptospira sp. WS92.C1]